SSTCTELWGDYVGIWAWNGLGHPSAHVRHRLELQSVVGILPTLLAVAGWLMLLLASLRSPARLAVTLLPLLGIVGYLYFTVSYPTHDGDVLKATYMLSTTAGSTTTAGSPVSANAADHSSGSAPASCQTSSKPASPKARSASSQTWCRRPVPTT